MTSTCRQPRTEVGAYALGALPPGESAELEAHVAACPLCTAEVHSLGAVESQLFALAAFGGDFADLLADDPPVRESGELW